MDLIKVQWNPALRPPRYYGHFFLAACQKPPYIFLWRKKTLVDTATPLIGQILFGPLVTVLTEFHYMLSCIKKRVWILAIGLRENPS